MTATHSIRHTVKAEIVQQLRAKYGTDVGVDVGYPGDVIRKRHVFALTTVGIVSVPTFKAGRLHRDDMFKIRWMMQAGPEGKDLGDAEAAVASLLQGLEDILADDASLGSSNDNPLGLEGVMAAEVTDVDGPDAYLTPEGAIAYVTATVEVHARYQ